MSRDTLDDATATGDIDVVDAVGVAPRGRHLAPALVAAVATTALFATFLSRPLFTATVMSLPPPLLAYLGLNWSAFGGLSFADVAGVEYLRVYVESVVDRRSSATSRSSE